MTRKNGNGKAPKTNGNSGKDDKGRFAPGNSYGHGGTYAATQKRKYQAVLLKATTEERFLEIVESTLEKAANGEAWAVREVFDRILGKPDQKIDANVAFTLADALARIRGTRLDRV